jgi:spore coat protein A
VRNALPTPTAVHLHGGNTAPDSDGFPTDVIAPGEQRTYTYANGSRAATLWYHDHVMGQTGRNVYMGLAGLYLLRDDEEDRLGLPSGAYELPLILQQRRFSEDGGFAYHEGDRIGVGGDVTLVNGVAWPILAVEARPYRLRMVNASNATRYVLRLSSGNPLTLIGVDGGLLSSPVACAAIPLAMGERADVIVDFSVFAMGTVVDLVTGELNDTGESLVRCVIGPRTCAETA